MIKFYDKNVIAQYTSYEVVKVYKDSDHPLARRVGEDDEALFIVCGDNFWRAEDFFFENNIYHFVVEYKTMEEEGEE